MRPSPRRSALESLALTLWDLVEPIAAVLRPPPTRAQRPPLLPPAPSPPTRKPPTPIEPAEHPPQARQQARRRRPSQPSRPNESSDAGMQARYDAVTKAMLQRYGIRVRRWRSSMSGVAWCVTYTNGTTARLIESPRPKGPMSAAVFLHEIGHHAIGFNVYKPRCLEEYHAWRWSLEQMEANDLNITEAVRRRMHDSLHYAVAKAKRRGIKSIPVELEPFLVRLPRPAKTSKADPTPRR